MSKKAAKFLASAIGGVATGVTGMYTWDRRPGGIVEADQTGKEGSAGLEAEEVIATPRSILPATSASSVASDFMMPFVERYGLPDLDQVILPSEEYTACWDARTRNARWVVERVNIDTVSGSGDRRRSRFRADSRLEPLFRSNLADYVGSGFDRGHLAPAGDHKTNQDNLTETFLLSNVAPQDPSFNRGYWSDFEEFVRILVEPTDGGGGSNDASDTSPPFKNVYVITGPLFLPSRETPSSSFGGSGSGEDDGAVDADGDGIVDVPTAPDATPADAKWVVKHDIIGNPMQMVAVPTHFFKVIIAEPYPATSNSNTNNNDGAESSVPTYVAAFAMPNTKIPNNTDLRNFLVPIEALESVAGMRFLGAAGALDPSERVSLDRQALQVREAAGVGTLAGDWGARLGSGYRAIEAGRDDGGATTTVGSGKEVVFRHLCTATSCRGV